MTSTVRIDETSTSSDVPSGAASSRRSLQDNTKYQSEADDHYHRLEIEPPISPRKSTSLSLLRQLSFQHIKSKSSMSRTDIESQGSRWYPERFEDNPQTKSGRLKLGKNRSKSGRREELLKDYEPTVDDYDDLEEMIEDEVYIVKQNKGYFSIAFSMVQTVVLAAMMIQCSIAPLQINPMIGPPPDALDYWGGKNSLKILKDNEEWRLLTPIFLHAGIIHLFCNVSVQLDVGEFFEREWGSRTWLFIYLVSAIGSSICSVCMMPDNISVGSSGAVMGLFGGKLGEIFCRACESSKTLQGRIGRDVRKEQLSAVLCSVTAVMAFSFVPYVDWAAHLGGLLAGFAVSFLCFAPKIKTKSYAIFWTAVGLALNVVFYSTLVTYMLTEVEPMNDLNDICGYYKQFFDDYECQCQKE